MYSNRPQPRGVQPAGTITTGRDSSVLSLIVCADSRTPSSAAMRGKPMTAFCRTCSVSLCRSGGSTGCSAVPSRVAISASATWAAAGSSEVGEV
ncbi:hypothetical protein SGLAM104S_02567 [Streptomyces glaucescens]